MKRAIFIMPADTDFNNLPPQVQLALQQFGFQYVYPQPGTVIRDGLMVADGVSNTDDLDAADFEGLGWTLLYYAQWDGRSPTLTEHVPLNLDAYMHYVPDVIEHDDEGEPTGSHPAERRCQHQWAGWPV